MQMNINAMGNFFYSLLKLFKTYLVLELFSFPVCLFAEFLIWCYFSDLLCDLPILLAKEMSHQRKKLLHRYQNRCIILYVIP